MHNNRLCWGFGLWCLCILTCTTAAAEPYDLNIQNFRPAPDARSLITVERSRSLGTFEPSLGLYLDHAWQPLKQSVGGREEVLVEHLMSGRFVLSIGFFNVVQIGGSLPISVIRADGDAAGLEPLVAGDGVGDAEAHLKITVLDSADAPVGVALAISAAFDTGQSNAFVSDAQALILRPRLVLDTEIGASIVMATNVGMILRDAQALDQPVLLDDPETGGRIQLPRNNPVIRGQALSYSYGVAWAITPQSLDLVFETYGEVALESGAQRAQPLEVLLGLKLYLLGNSFFTFGVTRGLLGQIGDPDIRSFAGIVFEPTTLDRDQDGLSDDDDECPSRPEDLDGFEDEDGCPDTDNDLDQIADIIDQCPDIPEDMNDFEDDDGCPDGTRDRDEDGLVDQVDRCPDDPEDRDGFQDQDGCPDPDNDQDSIADVRDQCPLVPEDYDGFEDRDGCPDTDNDKDGIVDRKDRCPDQAENIDGVDDEDGCPEATVVVTREKIEIQEKVYFETAKATIQSRSHDLLKTVAQTLKEFPHITLIEVQGHTDSRGDDDYNLDLSQRRAAAVRAYLMEQGVDGSRLQSRGYGEEKPVEPAENQAAWSKNRRVEFVIMKQAGKRPPKEE